MSITPIITRRQDADESADPLRAALREAIQAEAAGHNAVTRARDAIGRAEAHLEKCEHALETATADVESAKDQDAANVAAAIHTATAVGAPTAARQARVLEQTAADAVDVIKSALARLRADLSDLEDTARSKRKAVDVALNALIGPVVELLLTSAAELKVKLAVNMTVIGLILDDAVQRGTPLAGLREKQEWLAARSQTEISGERIMAAIAATRQSLTRLRQDAGAPLPLPPP
jgi:hypothetical protein